MMSMSSSRRPASFRSFGTAKTGPMPISSGSQPATTKPRKTPSGSMPSALARLADMRSVAEAPSENWEELPAVTVPPSRKAGGSLARPSRVVSGRLHSSRSTVTSLVDFAPVALSVTSMVTVIGAISSFSLPDLCAAAVEALRALGEAAAHHHVLDLAGVELRRFAQDGLDAMSGHVVGPRQVEGAAERLGEARPLAGDDDGFTRRHDVSSAGRKHAPGLRYVAARRRSRKWVTDPGPVQCSRPADAARFRSPLRRRSRYRRRRG